MLHPAAPEDVVPFIELLERAAERLTAAGVRQWTPGTMRQQGARLRQLQSSGEVLVVRAGAHLLGGVVLSRHADPVWQDAPRPHAGYVSKLVVDRHRAPPGLGAAILADVEVAARGLGFEWLRLDCVAGSSGLAGYYQALGYSPRGVVSSGGLELQRHEKELVDVDFNEWRPVAHATLMFVVQRERVLLIHKKRGHGAGKINGPGGAVEPGEKPLDAAVRETREEVGIDVHDARAAAELRFRDPHEPALCGYVFVASRFSGTPVETAEAIPFWCDRDAVPFGRMWSDDVLWLPPVLDGKRLIGDFLMHGQAVRAHRLRYVDELPF